VNIVVLVVAFYTRESVFTPTTIFSFITKSLAPGSPILSRQFSSRTEKRKQHVSMPEVYSLSFIKEKKLQGVMSRNGFGDSFFFIYFANCDWLYVSNIFLLYNYGTRMSKGYHFLPTVGNGSPHSPSPVS
jgi:hypothetical protein